VFGSATPSIEKIYLAKQSLLNVVELKNRVSNLSMPTITIIDMVDEVRRGNSSFISGELESRLKQNAANNKQSILFINRRGFSSFLRCIECGHVPKCTDCDVSLTFHKEDNQLKCHYCNKKFKVLHRCPECQSDKIRLGGVGTERVCEELKKILPTSQIFRMDNDTTKTKNAHFEILENFKNTKNGVLVGTQMIAKGHDFENVELVGVIDADLSLYSSDYKSAEKTYQLISQVAGRAGRKSGKGEVILQTYSPKHFVYSFVKANDFLGFYDREINLRQVTKFPPFSSLVRILVTSLDDAIAKQTLKKLWMKMQVVQSENDKSFIYLDAAKSPIKRISNNFRYQILMRLLPDKKSDIIDQISAIINESGVKGVTIFLELNPQNLT
jgi:primosomal protein N' (replication factor Y)